MTTTRFNYRHGCEVFAQSAADRLQLPGTLEVSSESGVKRLSFTPDGESWQSHVSPGCATWAELYYYLRGLADGAEGLPHLRELA